MHQHLGCILDTYTVLFCFWYGGEICASELDTVAVLTEIDKQFIRNLNANIKHACE